MDFLGVHGDPSSLAAPPRLLQLRGDVGDPHPLVALLHHLPRNHIRQRCITNTGFDPYYA
jgi:hypothetical protein